MQFIAKSHHLKPGDVVTEAGIHSLASGRSVSPSREVRISDVEYGSINYHGHVTPVWFVTGEDLGNGDKVRWTANNWRRWTADREMSTPVTAGV
jgi:hypothetical protein